MSERKTSQPKPPAGPLPLRPPAPGEAAPAFELPDSRGQLHRLDEMVSEGPQVLLFYRGHW